MKTITKFEVSLLFTLIIIDSVLIIAYINLQGPNILTKLEEFHHDDEIYIKIKVINYGNSDCNISFSVSYKNIFLLNNNISSNFIVPKLSKYIVYLQFKIIEVGKSDILIQINQSQYHIIVNSIYKMRVILQKIWVKTDSNFFGPGNFYVLSEVNNKNYRYPKEGYIEIEGNNYKIINEELFSENMYIENITNFEVCEDYYLFGIWKNTKTYGSTNTILLPNITNYELSMEQSKIYIATISTIEIFNIAIYSV